MSDNERPQPDTDADDVYVLEDTGESLDDFTPELASTQKTEAPAAEPQSPSAEVQSLRDQLLRSRADFDNFRKRSEKEKNDYFRYAMTQFILELIPVLDNFERALATETSKPEDLRIGVEMIFKQMSDVLQKAGLKPVESAPNTPFDPTRHEAVMREETDAVPSHTVLDVFQKGYFLHDRLIRPAMVKVAVGGPDRVASGEEQA